MGPALEKVLSNVRYKVQSNKFMAFCPAHPDGEKNDRPSLHISRTMGEDGGRVVLHCFAGCPTPEIVERMGLEMKDLFDHNYEEEDEPAEKPTRSGKVVENTEHNVCDVHGNVQAIHVRKVYEGGGKDFAWKKPDGSFGGIKTKDVPLYNSPDISKAREGRGRIMLVEGEKACDALRAARIPSAATVTGSSTIPSDEVLKSLSGLSVVLWPDADEAGKRHMTQVAEKLVELGIEVRWFNWQNPPKKKGADAADHPALVSKDKEAIWNLAKELAASPAYGEKVDPKKGSAFFSVHRSRFDEYLQRKETGEGIMGLRTGFAKLDGLMGGLEKQESVLVGAMPGEGKSVFVTQVAVNVAEKEGERVLLQSSEMPGFTYSKRIAHALSGVPDDRREDAPRLTKSQIQQLREAHERLEAMPLQIDDVKPDIRRIRHNIETFQPRVVVIDHLHRMKGDGNNSRYIEVGKISEALAELKTVYPEITWVVAAQFSRDLAKRNDKRPNNSDFRDAGDVEADADWTLLFFRPGFHDGGKTDKGTVEVRCGKARHGEPFDTMLHNIENQAWFTESPAHVFQRPKLQVVGGQDEDAPPFRTR